MAALVPSCFCPQLHTFLLSRSFCRTFVTGGGWSLRRIWGIVSAPFLFFSWHPFQRSHWAHTPRSIYLKQMLSDAAPLCGGKMRPSSSLRSLLSPFLSPSTLPSAPFLFFFPFTRARSLRRFARRSLLPLAAVEAGVLPRRFEELPVHGFPIPEKLASDIWCPVTFSSVYRNLSRSFVEYFEKLTRN